MNESTTTHIAEVIEETLSRRVKNTIDEYCAKNSDAFAQNRIAGVEWNLNLTVLVDTLRLNPQPKPKTLFQRFIDFFRRLCRKAENNQGPGDLKAH